MQNRSVASVIILTLVTFGIYGLVWAVKTKNEMNAQGADIPTAWLLIVPIASLWWLWKYSAGVEHVTKGKMSAIMTLVLFWLIGIVGMAIVQHEFNQLNGAAPVASGDAPMPAAEPAATTPADTPNPPTA